MNNAHLVVLVVETSVEYIPRQHQLPIVYTEHCGANRSDDGLLLVLQVLIELSTSPVVPDQVRVLCVAVQDLQQLQVVV